MTRNRTLIALIALLALPALACQTVMGALGSNSNPTPVVAPVVPSVGTVEPPALESAVPEGTIAAIATSALSGEGPSDVPVMDGASNVVASSQLVSYETTTSFDDTVKFYKDQMPANGWAEGQGSISFGDNTVLNYSKDNRQAVVTISKSGDTTIVAVVIQ